MGEVYSLKCMGKNICRRNVQRRKYCGDRSTVPRRVVAAKIKICGLDFFVVMEWDSLPGLIRQLLRTGGGFFNVL